MATITATTPTACPCCDCKSTALLCRIKGGVAELCGFDEFTTPSIPPRKYKKKTTGGTLNKGTWPSAGCPGASSPTTYSDGWVGSEEGSTWGDSSGSMTATPVEYDSVNNRIKYRLTAKSWTRSTYGTAWGSTPNESPWDIRLVITPASGGSNTLSTVGNEVWLSRASGSNPHNFFIQAYWPLAGWIGASTSSVNINVANVSTSLIRDVWNLIEQYNPDAGCVLSQTDTSQRYVGVGTFPLSGGTASGGPSLTDFSGLTTTTTTTLTRTVAGSDTCVGSGPSSKATGTRTETLTDEDTENAAIDRLLAASSWSEWRSPGLLCTQPACCLAQYEDREGFTFAYQAAQWKVVRSGLAPSTAHIVKVQIWRREFGVGDFVKYSTLEESVMSDASGNLEKTGDVPNDLGYESYAHSACVQPVA